MSNTQYCFVDRKLLINALENNNLENNELKNDDENFFDEIVDDKCDDEIIIHVFSQFKKKNTLLTRFLVVMF